MNKLVNVLRRGRNSKYTGTIVYSPFFGTHLRVTRYVNDRTWWFTFAERGKAKEYRAQTPLSNFLKD